MNLEQTTERRPYEPPALVDLGRFVELTESSHCLSGKQHGRSDGIGFHGNGLPIANCSS